MTNTETPTTEGKGDTMSEREGTPVMVGQMYRRVRGPEMFCEVLGLEGDQAYCWMSGAGRDYGRKPVPISLLHTDQFKLVAL